MAADVTRREFPILEYDSDTVAVIEPRQATPQTVLPPAAVLCFFQEVIDRWREDGTIHRFTHLSSAAGQHPVYEWSYRGEKMILFHPGIGGPLAVMLVEELIALGCRTFIACGGAGVLLKEVTAGHLVVPTAAVRDEGVSYHYQPAGREVEPTPAALAAIIQVLTTAQVSFRCGKTWTTDAVYRETPAKVALRREEGCLTVEMEAAALFALAKFRRVTLGHILYGGDDVSGLTWNRRSEFDRTDVREALVRLAAEACAVVPSIERREIEPK